MGFRRRLCVLFVGLLVSAGRAYAAPNAAERDTARALMDEGDRLLASDKLAEACQRYRAAHAIMHVPTTGFDLARVEARLGLLVEARATAMEVVNLPPLASSLAAEPEVFQRARAGAVELVRDLEPRVPSLRTVVTPATSSYQLQIDGSSLPAAARLAPFRTNPGPHTVRAEAVGFVAAQREITLAEGESLEVTLELTRLEAAEAPVDRRAPDAALRRDALLDARAAGKARGFVGLGVGAAGIIAGSATGIIAMMKTNDERRLCQDNHCDVSRAEALRTANLFASIANVSFALGGLGVAYGLYELLTLPSMRVDLGVGSLQLRGAL